MPPAKRRNSQHFFTREGDGTVRLRLRLSPEEAALIEEAAGSVPLMTWLYRQINDAAEQQVREARRAAGLDLLPPPEGIDPTLSSTRNEEPQ